MTEVRPYARADAEALVEDFRRKLNTYVYAIRSGQLADSGADGAPPTGFDIVLFCPDEPVPLVQEMIATANSALTAESVTVRWRQLEELLTAAAAAASPERPLEQLSTEELVVALGQALVAELPPGWETAWYLPAIVVSRSQDDLFVRLGDGTDVAVEPPARAREIVRWLRHRMYTPQRGTWLSATIQLEAAGALYTSWNYDEEPKWRRPLPSTAYREELDTYPRGDRMPDWLAREFADPS